MSRISDTEKKINININVEFFKDNITNSIGAGIYGIYIKLKDEEKDEENLLYIGESVFVAVRCSTHLYEIAKGNGYLGFTKDKLENNNITLVFKLLESDINIKKDRKDKEIELIKELKPLMQSGISDRVKPVEGMIKELTNFLKNDTDFNQ